MPTAAGFKYGTSSNNLNQTASVSVSGTSGTLSANLTGLIPGTTYYYQAFVTVYGTGDYSSENQTVYGAKYSFTTPAVATASVTTNAATNVGSNTVTLNASFSGASGTIYDRGFRYKKGNGNWVTPTGLGSTTGTQGSFSMEIGSLTPSSTYTFQAYVMEWDAEQNEYVVRWASNTLTFTTTAQGTPTETGWLELPAVSTGSGFVDGHFGTGKSRNYSYHYDTNMYTALWTAYPLTASHITGSASTTTWDYNPNVDESLQINVKKNSYGTNYGNNTYSRGHQLPAADRKCDNTMRSQTYYLTNQTPQIQQGFNSPMWSDLEDAVRNLTNSTDTVYVVTGAAFQKKGETKAINYLSASSPSITPSSVPVPNYYWKVLLRVQRSGGQIISAKAIGIWMEHKTYTSNTAWLSATFTVDQIEEWTGFDFFHNLPDDLEAAAENISSWSSFTSTSNVSGVKDNNWGSF